MPCRDYHDSDEYLTQLRRRELDTYAQMLCGVCRRIEALVADGNIVSMDEITDLIERDDKLVRWWADHKKADAKRLAEEKERKRQKVIKRQALAKLTAEEMEALGIRGKK